MIRQLVARHFITITYVVAALIVVAALYRREPS